LPGGGWRFELQSGIRGREGGNGEAADGAILWLSG
jgi:hypothetical protein